MTNLCDDCIHATILGEDRDDPRTLAAFPLYYWCDKTRQWMRGNYLFCKYRQTEGKR